MRTTSNTARGVLHPQDSAAKLIDVEKNCVVPAGDNSYLALSYVWGQAECVTLTSRTRASLETEGALHLWPLPKTIRQAMELVLLLRQRYLWVDRLCIDQDDGPAKQAQIASWQKYTPIRTSPSLPPKDRTHRSLYGVDLSSMTRTQEQCLSSVLMLAFANNTMGRPRSRGLISNPRQTRPPGRA